MKKIEKINEIDEMKRIKIPPPKFHDIKLGEICLIVQGFNDDFILCNGDGQIYIARMDKSNINIMKIDYDVSDTFPYRVSIFDDEIYILYRHTIYIHGRL